MPSYSFIARTPLGATRRGTEEAAAAGDVVRRLRDRGWLVLEVRPITSGASLVALLNPMAWLPPGSVDVEQGLQQLSILLRSGMTLLASLTSLAEFAGRRSIGRVWRDVAEAIQRGSTLADAMSRHRCFHHFVVQLVRVGEQTGTLEQVTTRAAEALESRRLLRTQVWTALTYPAIVLFASIGVTAYMIIVLIPKLKVFLAALGRKLPAMTQFLLDVSDFTTAYLPTIVIGLVSLTVALTAVYLWPPGRLACDRLFLSVPLVRRLVRLATTAGFARNLGVLLKSGITLVGGLRTAEQTVANRYAQGRIRAALEGVLNGGSLAAGLAAGVAFTPLLARMVSVGEASGTLDDVLLEVARFHEVELQTTIRRLAVLVEPALVVAVGSVVGFVYIAFFMALFAAAGSVR